MLPVADQVGKDPPNPPIQVFSPETKIFYPKPNTFSELHLIRINPHLVCLQRDLELTVNRWVK